MLMFSPCVHVILSDASVQAHLHPSCGEGLTVVGDCCAVLWECWVIIDHSVLAWLLIISSLAFITTYAFLKSETSLFFNK